MESGVWIAGDSLRARMPGEVVVGSVPQTIKWLHHDAPGIFDLGLDSLFVFCEYSRVGQHMNAPGASCNQPSSTVEEASCFAKASDAADKELNGFYARVRSVLTPEERSDLLQAQRAWLKYRDLTCTAEFKLYGGGTGGPVTRMACLAAITQERVATLKTTYGWRLEK